MILVKLQEALKEVDAQRRALDEVESQLRSMISKLSGIPAVSSPEPSAYQVHFGDAIPKKDRDRIDDIIDILLQVGQPLHINQIAERLSSIYGKKISRTTIEPGLNRHIQKAKTRRVDKFGRSIFGLPQWKVQPTLSQIAS